MSKAIWQKNRYHKALDALSSRIGILLSTGFLISLCLGAGVYTQSVVKQLEQTQALFKDRQIRNGYVAISDIQRLILVAQRAVHTGKVTPELDQQFRDAADILYVRTEHLKTILSDDEDFVSGTDAIESLNAVLSVADQIIAVEYADLRLYVDDMLVAAEIARTKLVSYLDVMRRHADGVMIAQLEIVNKQQVIMTGSLAGLTLVGIIALVLLRMEVLGRRARDKVEKRVEFLAFFDPLTELPNRVQFQERLEDMLERAHTPIALLFIDLDDFKAINDTYGHAAGDAVLQRTGKILLDAAETTGGFAARLGGDEFALVAPTDDPKVLASLCDLMIAQSAIPFSVEAEKITCSVSIGLATTTQVSGSMFPTVDTLSRVTDFALYASKSDGRNRYTMYDLVLEKRFLERRAMLEELPKAIVHEDLEVYLQPKVELPNGSVYGFEALIRWRRDGKIINPDEFMLLAEESGLVVDIDNYVLNQAAKMIAEHNKLHGTAFSISVNLSALHFNSRKIIKSVEDALWRSDLQPDLLTLEITETTEMCDWHEANNIIDAIHQLGCKISIDDFGTGFSSLAYLRAMIADELKIDRSLVEEIETSEKARLMLTSVFEIARHMELEIVVEGVETEAQSEIVYHLGAHRAQGFLYGRPAPAGNVLEKNLGPQTHHESRIIGRG